MGLESARTLYQAYVTILQAYYTSTFVITALYFALLGYTIQVAWNSNIPTFVGICLLLFSLFVAQSIKEKLPDFIEECRHANNAIIPLACKLEEEFEANTSETQSKYAVSTEVLKIFLQFLALINEAIITFLALFFLIKVYLVTSTFIDG